MSKVRSHKKQHWVPQSYLRAWLDSDAPASQEYVWVYSRMSQKLRRKSPKNLFYETDMYTRESEDGSRDLQIEHSLSRLESKFCSLRDHKLAQLAELDEEDIITLVTFTSAMAVRTQPQRDHIRSEFSNILAVADNLAESMARMSPEQKKKAGKVSELGSSRGASMSHDDLRRLVANPFDVAFSSMVRGHIRGLGNMRYSILCNETAVPFVTTDSPVTRFDPHPPPHPFFANSPSLTSPTVEVTLPVSPSRLVIFAQWADYSYLNATNDRIIHEMNRRACAHCRDDIVLNSGQMDDRWLSEHPLPR